MPLELVVLVAGCAILALPTFVMIVTESWNTEQGSHGPIVFMTGLWLLVRLWPQARAVMRPPPLLPVVASLLVLAPLLVFARVVQVLEIEGFVMYALLVTALYSVIGWQALLKLWFPLLYLAFIFPLPDTLVAMITLPLKNFISAAAVNLLHAAGYPVGGVGVIIMIGPYELLVAAACSGISSIISLSVIALFYLFVRHDGYLLPSLPSVVMIVPIAVMANLIRVIILILLTYYAGDAAAQGFLHGFAGLVMFVAALGLLIAWDSLITRFLPRRRRTVAA